MKTILKDKTALLKTVNMLKSLNPKGKLGWKDKNFLYTKLGL